MSSIAQNTDPTDGSYSFIINCNPTNGVAKDCKRGKKSPIPLLTRLRYGYAFTDATVPKDADDIKSMWLCPLFFTSDNSKNDLPSRADADKAKLDAWCNQDSYKNFTTAGHVLLHEIIHLDAVAKEFPLIADPVTKAHGTMAYNQVPSPMEWARRLKIRIDSNPNCTDLPAPSYKAENYAAAATELWAMEVCEKSFIPPKSGYN